MADQIPFALAPAASTNEVIDYRTAEGKKVYKAATAPLWKDDPYDLSAQGLFQFLESLESRGHQFGWTQNPDGVCFVPRNPEAVPLGEDDNPSTDFFEGYAGMTLERIQQWERRMEADQMKAAQDSNQIFHCIMNSITVDARTTLTLEKDDYEFDTQQGGRTIQGGLALLKLLTSFVVQETPGMAAIVRMELTNLKDTFLKLDSDVSAFNVQIKLLIKRLNRLGQEESEQDLLLQLFDAYANAHDEDFAKYIESRKAEHDDGRNAVTYKQLMALALQKFKLAKRKGTWQAPTPTQEKLMALQAQLKTMESKIETHKKKVTFLSNKKEEKGKGKPFQGASKDMSKPNWLTNHTPPSNVKDKRTWKDPSKPYHWCCKETGGKCGGMWRVHRPDQCKGLKRGSDSNTSSKGSKPKPGNGNKKARMVVAQEARQLLLQNGFDPEDAIVEAEE